MFAAGEIKDCLVSTQRASDDLTVTTGVGAYQKGIVAYKYPVVRSEIMMEAA
jgi:hypothetical protein